MLPQCNHRFSALFRTPNDLPELTFLGRGLSTERAEQEESRQDSPRETLPTGCATKDTKQVATKDTRITKWPCTSCCSLRHHALLAVSHRDHSVLRGQTLRDLRGNHTATRPGSVARNPPDWCAQSDA
jgi:hypothetical protein